MALLFAATANVAYWPLADITTVLIQVRFRGNSGHYTDVRRCLLLTSSRHGQTLLAISRLLTWPATIGVSRQR